MRKLQGVAAFAASLIVAVSNAGEPGLGGYARFEMPAYTIVSRNEGIARDLVQEIERIDRLLGMLLESPSRSQSAPVHILVVPGVTWKRYLAPGTAIVGEFVPGRFSNYLLLSSGKETSIRASLYHEYTHLFLRTQFRGICPLWFDEGLAEVMQTTRFRGPRADLGLPPGPYGNWNVGYPPGFNNGWLPVDRLLRLDKSSPEYRDSRHSAAVHMESWGLVHKGLIAEPEFGKMLFAYLNALDELQPVDSALESSFGMTSKQLDSSLRNYLSRLQFSMARIELEPKAPVALVPGVPLAEVEALEFLAEVMLVSGFKPDRLEEVISAAYRRAPDSASVQILRMRLAIRDGDDASFTRLLKDIEPRTSDPKIARGVGLALVERMRVAQIGDQFDIRAPPDLGARALAMLDRAIRTQPGDPEAVWAYGLLAALTKSHMSTALTRVRQASTELPGNADLAMAAALLHDALGETEQSVQWLQDTVRFSASVEQRAWARNRLERMRTVVSQ